LCLSLVCTLFLVDFVLMQQGLRLSYTHVEIEAVPS
jgi:hypothetical protein